MEFTLDDMHKTDWTQVRSIYAASLKTGLAASCAKLEKLGFGSFKLRQDRRSRYQTLT